MITRITTEKRTRLESAPTRMYSCCCTLNTVEKVFEYLQSESINNYQIDVHPIMASTI